MAQAFVRWTGVPPGRHWLDVGTGTGALASAILEIAEPSAVIGCDPSGPFVDSARASVRDPRATFVVAGVVASFPPGQATTPWCPASR